MLDWSHLYADGHGLAPSFNARTDATRLPLIVPFWDNVVATEAIIEGFCLPRPEISEKKVKVIGLLFFFSSRPDPIYRRSKALRRAGATLCVHVTTGRRRKETDQRGRIRCRKGS